MKLESLAEGSPDCPLIRLYSFSRLEVLRLKNVTDRLATGKLQEIALHEEPGFEPIDGCMLFFKSGKGDQGIVEDSHQAFDCVLSDGGWLDVSFLLEPFCETDTTGFEWLVDKGPISLLISVKGTW